MHKYYTIPDETGNTNITHKQKEYIQWLINLVK
jgi:hypothetical protein